MLDLLKGDIYIAVSPQRRHIYSRSPQIEVTLMSSRSLAKEMSKKGKRLEQQKQGMQSFSFLKAIVGLLPQKPYQHPLFS